MPVHHRLVDVPGLPAGAGYSHAVVASGRLAYVSGQVSVDASGTVVGEGDLAAQTRQAMANLARVLAELGAGWADVLRLNWYVVDAEQLPGLRAVRREVLGPPEDAALPASTLVQVAALADPRMLVEVEAVVALPD
jgi:enamine deaminase RidA (YjgF/YER057c/UK114 family)